MFLILIPFSLIKSVTEFWSNSSSVLKSSQRIYGSSVVRYCHLEEEALDRTMWRARFGRGFGPAVRQTAKLINECH